MSKRTFTVSSKFVPGDRCWYIGRDMVLDELDLFETTVLDVAWRFLDAGPSALMPSVTLAGQTIKMHPAVLYSSKVAAVRALWRGNPGQDVATVRVYSPRTGGLLLHQIKRHGKAGWRRAESE